MELMLQHCFLRELYTDPCREALEVMCASLVGKTQTAFIVSNLLCLIFLCPVVTPFSFCLVASAAHNACTVPLSCTHPQHQLGNLSLTDPPVSPPTSLLAYPPADTASSPSTCTSAPRCSSLNTRSTITSQFNAKQFGR